MKKLYLAGLLFAAGLVILTLPVLAQEFLTIQITNDNNHLALNVIPIPSDAIDSSDGLNIPVNAGITNANKINHTNLIPIPSDAIDSSDGQIIPVQAAACNSDKTLTLELTPIDFSAPSPKPEPEPEPEPKPDPDPDPDPKLTELSESKSESKLAKTPVLFVPGLLGTELVKNGEILWADPLKMINPANSDNFMDPLVFNEDLKPSDSEVFYTNVIIQKSFRIGNINDIKVYDYLSGLINAFQEQGYITNEGSADQDFFTFPYDWRYGVSGVIPNPANLSQRPLTNIDLLSARINQLAAISPTGRVDVIAHSLGGLVVKKYVVDTDNPKIGKLIFVGTPNLGAPLSAKVLLQGHNFDIFGLNPDEIKKISRNLPSAYDLLPSLDYFATHSGYITLVRQKDFTTNEVKTLNYDETNNYLLASGLINQQGINNARSWHTSAFDEYNITNKVPDTYNLVGCKSATYSMLEDWQDVSANHRWYESGIPLTGDGTVPFESADSILTNPAATNNVFYIPKANHGKMPSQEIIRQKITSIISGEDNANDIWRQIFTYQQVKNNPRLCQLFGDIIEIHSPLDIAVVDAYGNTLQNIPNQGYYNTIPGASFYINDNNHKYVYLPTGDNETYDIKLTGTGSGVFTLIDKKLNNQTITLAYAFKDKPVTPDFSATLRLTDNTDNTADTAQPPLIILPDNTQIEPELLTPLEDSNDRLANDKLNDDNNDDISNTAENHNKIESNNNSSNNKDNKDKSNNLASSSYYTVSSYSNSSQSGGQKIIPAVAGASTHRLSLQEIAASLEKSEYLSISWQ